MNDAVPMIVLFTDFGLAGPYTGQMKAVLRGKARGAEIIDLFADAPQANPKAAAYLLAAYAAWFPAGTIFLAVVDPGVGGSRAPLALEADGKFFVGPDNGLFELVLRRARRTMAREIAKPAGAVSASFHGRDIFAPEAARIAGAGTLEGSAIVPRRHPGWPDDLGEIVYLDHYGNALTGLRAASLPAGAALAVAAGRRIPRAETFSAVPPGAVFWYENSNGLAEIAINRGSAQSLGLAIGSPVAIVA